MGYLILLSAISASVMVIFIFTIVWFLMRKRDSKLNLSLVWFICGFLVSSLMVGTIQLVFGGAPYLPPHSSRSAMWTMHIFVPIIISIIVCAFIRTRYNKEPIE